MIVWPLLAHLQAMDRGTARAYHRCFENISPKFEFLKRFERKVRVSTSDCDRALVCAEQSRRATDLQFVRFPCHVHIAAAVLKKAGKILDYDISGMVNLSLSLHTPGSMVSFRKCFRDVLAKMPIEINVGSPPVATTAANRRLLDILFEGCGPYDRIRRQVIESITNGDWTRTDCLEVWVAKPTSVRELIHLLQSKWIQAVCGAAPFVYPRHRWAGAEHTMRWILVLRSVHGLLATTYSQWTAKPVRADPAAAVRIPDAPAADGEIPAGGGDVGQDVDHVAQPGPLVSSELISYDPAIANAAQDVIELHMRENSKWRKTASEWLQEDASLARTLIFRRVQEGQRRLMRDLLRLGGEAWERGQAWRQLKAASEQRFGHAVKDFRVTIAANGRLAMCENPMLRVDGAG